MTPMMDIERINDFWSSLKELPSPQANDLGRLTIGVTRNCLECAVSVKAFDLDRARVAVLLCQLFCPAPGGKRLLVKLLGA